LTFDDGYQSVYDGAFPVLREFQTPATLFLATAYLGSKEPYPFDPWALEHWRGLPPAAYCPLAIDQVREMIDSGLVDVGAHTHTHRDLREQPDSFHSDLQISVDFLRDTFALKEVMFAFPFGGRHTGFAGPQMVQAAKQTGVNCGLTTECSLIDGDDSTCLTGIRSRH
jgi:peptidoglycan/xylan/chitin deacetylase (PgdA/CDA1 family)